MTSIVQRFFHHDAAGGMLLMFAAVAAMMMANSPLVDYYNGFLNIPVVVSFGDFVINKPLLLWINDGLMAVFFFLIGLEIKREVTSGHLRSTSQITLPGVAAIAGIAAPAVIYAVLNVDDTVAIKGWAIPSATDIAFALGIFVLFGRGLPTSLKLFLLSVAIFDDIGAIVIIAIFYSAELSTYSLSWAAACLIGLAALNYFRVTHQSAYFILGVVMWVAVLKSGVHATLAGFVAAWFIPLEVKNTSGFNMLPHIERTLHPWVAFIILPIFAFANAGVNILGASLSDLFNPVTVGIAAGLFVGKQFGIFGVCLLVIKLGLAKLPKGATWMQLYGVSLLCGIGFTMSLFIGTLAFEQQGLDYQLDVKVGVLMGSIVSALVGAVVLRRAKPLSKNLSSEEAKA